MVEWKYCGRFNNWTQDAAPAPFDWIDEDEAKRRYHDSSKELTIVPPKDESTGIYPFYIVVTTGPVVSFAVVEMIPPGVIQADSRFTPAEDGRLFMSASTVSEFPPTEQIPSAKRGRPLRTIQVTNREDGTGTLLFTEQGESAPLKSKREDIPVADLYRQVPEWGEWQILRQRPSRGDN